MQKGVTLLARCSLSVQTLFFYITWKIQHNRLTRHTELSCVALHHFKLERRFLNTEAVVHMRCHNR
ncbi:hypothetical protein D3C86_2193870 [compost metagenome]